MAGAGFREQKRAGLAGETRPLSPAPLYPPEAGRELAGASGPIHFKTKDTAMNEQQAEAIASALDGEAWQSGGGMWVVTVTRDDGTLVVFSGDAICEYESDDAFDVGRASNTI